jgi:hypothetical protein
MGSNTLPFGGVRKLAGKRDFGDGLESRAAFFSPECFVRGLQAEMYCMSHQTIAVIMGIYGRVSYFRMEEYIVTLG